jgi:hypothetical protein
MDENDFKSFLNVKKAFVLFFFFFAERTCSVTRAREMEKKSRNEARQNGLCLNKHPLPSSIEFSIFSWLKIWDLGALGFTSRGMRASLERHLAGTTRCDLNGGTNTPMKQDFLFWMLGQIMRHCRNLRTIHGSLVLFGSQRADNFRNWLSILIRRNRSTFQYLDSDIPPSWTCPSVRSALVDCPKLSKLNNLFEKEADEPELAEREMLIESVTRQCPQLTDLELIAKDDRGGYYPALSSDLTQMALKANFNLLRLATTLCPDTVPLLTTTAHLGLTTLDLDTTENSSVALYRDLAQQLQQLPKLTDLALKVNAVEEKEHDIIWRLPIVVKLRLETSETDFQPIPIVAPNLQSFTGVGRADPEGAILKHSPELLTYRILAFGANAPDIKQIALKPKSSRLHTLELSSEFGLTLSKIQAMVSAWKNSLRHLQITYQSFVLFERDIWCLLVQLPLLETAVISSSKYGTSTTTPSAEQPLRVAPNLTRLVMDLITDTCVTSNPISFPRLTSLQLQSQGVCLKHFGNLLNRMPQLTELNASDHCLLAGIYNSKAPISVPQLTSISLRNVHVMNTDDAQKLIGASSARLRTLEIHECLFDMDLPKTLCAFELRQLETLDFFMAHETELKTLRTLLTRVPTLGTLRFGGKRESLKRTQLMDAFPNVFVFPSECDDGNALKFFLDPNPRDCDDSDNEDFF